MREMDEAGGQEVFPSCIQLNCGKNRAADVYGKELFRIKDRYERDFCLGIMHEEIITALVRAISSGAIYRSDFIKYKPNFVMIASFRPYPLP